MKQMIVVWGHFPGGSANALQSHLSSPRATSKDTAAPGRTASKQKDQSPSTNWHHSQSTLVNQTMKQTINQSINQLKL